MLPNHYGQIMTIFDRLFRNSILCLPDHIGKIAVNLDFNSEDQPFVILTRVMTNGGELVQEGGELVLRTERYRLIVNNDGFVEAVFEGEIPV